MARAFLTPRKQEIYEFIVAFKKSHDGNSPSLAEIGEACNLKAPSHVRDYLFGLERLGFIKCNYEGGKPRMIEVVGAKWTPPHLRSAKPQAAFE